MIVEIDKLQAVGDAELVAVMIGLVTDEMEDTYGDDTRRVRRATLQEVCRRWVPEEIQLAAFEILSTAPADRQ